ncbi:reverse transcriptase/maturase family protein [Eubacterium sp. 1001713B170207_170306_E7]|uniref:reverse transcriptase/maturase family protein n=1 Tax=Eubacterium sp. 1001713B170207_170306_E7 TaxID=2787097 RepID=UPI0018995191|nr:reverse transcriptase/maturase family protein [Eubacterium sp. 1001713B170207_170306_E7]
MEINKERLEKWKKENSSPAGYAHFDTKFGLNSAWDYIANPDNVAKHSFFPFIHYDKVFYKAYKASGEYVDKETNSIVRLPKKQREVKIKDKIRPICYSSHIDRCIYQYYGFLLNEHYNQYVDEQGFSSSVVAYRTNLHQNNIHFAKRAFDFIKQAECNIIVGDFKGFFDNLDHKTLKQNLCTVLGTSTLSPDWYAVFKNITKYSMWDLVDILKINGLITDEDIAQKQAAHEVALNGNTRKARELITYFDGKIKELNGFNIEDPKKRFEKLALTKEQFKQNKKDYIKPHKENFGIPQGSAISAVLSNVYMIDFDKKLYNFIHKFDGLYLRYSDDFIIILPSAAGITWDELKTYMHGVVYETEHLTLEKKKTQIYSYRNNQITNNTNPNAPSVSYIDYLGFVFDGKEITLRPKTISKYYYRMYKKLNHIVKCGGVTKKKNKVSYENLYRTYTQKGRNGEYDKSKLPQKVIKKNPNNPYKSGNFFSYVQKADEIFNPEYVGKNKVEVPQKPKEPITQATKRHMLKIRRIRDKI